MVFLVFVKVGKGPTFELRWNKKSNNKKRALSVVVSLLYKTNRFHVAVRLVSYRSRKTSKCDKDISDTLGYRLVCHFFVLTTFWRHLWSIKEQTHSAIASRSTFLGQAFIRHLFICDPHVRELISTYLYNNQINARSLIGQSAIGYCAGKPTENWASSELLYKSNKPQVSVCYRLINHLGCL